MFSPLPAFHADRDFAVVKDFQLGDLHTHADHAGHLHQPAREFADLIDSSLNTLEDGFDKSASNGFEITVLGKHTELLSFFRDNLTEQPLWQLRFDEKSNALQFKPLNTAPVLTLTAQQRVGIATDTPASTLHVAGVITQHGQRGYQPNGKAQIPADGQWHDISGPLQGCQAFDVMAGTGNKGSGKYALLKATAINTFNPGGWWFNFLRFSGLGMGNFYRWS